MAVPPFNPNEALPADDDIVSQFPAVERTFRDTIEDWLNFEHDPSGHHKIPVITEAARDAITDWVVGSLVYNTDEEQLEILTDDSPVTFSPAGFPVESGTWTPELSLGGVTTGITYIDRGGQWYKIGGFLHLFGFIRLSNNGSGVGEAFISGMPENPEASPLMRWNGAVTIYNGIINLDEFTTNVATSIINGDTAIALQAYDIAADSAFVLEDTQVGPDANFSFNITYKVA